MRQPLLATQAIETQHSSVLFSPHHTTSLARQDIAMNIALSPSLLTMQATESLALVLTLPSTTADSSKPHLVENS